MPIGSNAPTMFRMDIRADDVNSGMQHGRCSNDSIPQQIPPYYKHRARFRPVCSGWSGANFQEITEYSQTEFQPLQSNDGGSSRSLPRFVYREFFPVGNLWTQFRGAIPDSEKPPHRSNSHRVGIGCGEKQNQKIKSEESLVKIESERRIH